MKSSVPGLFLFLGLLCPGLAMGQGPVQVPPLPPPGAAEQSATGSMYEDIEVFRRLLNRKLQNQYPAVRATGLITTQYCQSCHNVPHTSISALEYLTSTAFDPLTKNVAFPPSAVHGDLSSYLRTNPHARQIADGAVRHLDTEGAYLRGQGVVYTVTLPPSAHIMMKKAISAPVRTVSEWDRTRREVRQEAPPAADQGKQPTEPTLAEVLLRTLADNGHHFVRLEEQESLTIVVTFRPDPVSVDPYHGGNPVFLNGSFDVDYLSPLNLSSAGSGKNGQPGQISTSGSSTGGTGKGTGSTTGSGQAGDDYELLGDLQQKQGKYEEALNAFQRALELKPESGRAAGLHRKIAQIYLAQNKDDQARAMLDRAIEFHAKQTSQPVKPPKPADRSAASTLPAKLIVSASRRLLAQVNSGKISFEEFQKAARVEYLTFPPGQK